MAVVGTWLGHRQPGVPLQHRIVCWALQSFTPREVYKPRWITHGRKVGAACREALAGPSIWLEGLVAASASQAHSPSRLPEGGPKKLRSNIRRSTETGIAVEMRTRVTRQGSRESTDGSTNSNSSDGT